MASSCWSYSICQDIGTVMYITYNCKCAESDLEIASHYDRVVSREYSLVNDTLTIHLEFDIE